MDLAFLSPDEEQRTSLGPYRNADAVSAAQILTVCSEPAGPVIILNHLESHTCKRVWGPKISRSKAQAEIRLTSILPLELDLIMFGYSQFLIFIHVV